MKNKTLEKIYWDVSQPGSLSGLENFFRVLKQKKNTNKKERSKTMVSNTGSIHKTPSFNEKVSQK